MECGHTLLIKKYCLNFVNGQYLKKGMKYFSSHLLQPVAGCPKSTSSMFILRPNSTVLLNMYSSEPAAGELFVSTETVCKKVRSSRNIKLG